MGLVSPRYQQVADVLRRRIVAGEYGPGDKIPTERELCAEFDVSTPVARAAKAELEREGLVVSHQGKGTFVRERKELVRWPRAHHRLGTSHGVAAAVAARGGKLNRQAEYRQVPAPPHVAARLGIEPGDMVAEVVYDWYVDDELVEISTQWEPLHITRGTPIEVPPLDPDDMTTGIERYSSIGLSTTEVVEYTRARMPTPDERRRFGLPAGVPVLEIERSHLAADIALEAVDIVLRGDRFVIEARTRVPSPKEDDEG